MDTNQLISETAQLYNKAAAARGNADDGAALAALDELRDLLNKEIPAEKPAEPETPPAEPTG
ncbi:hypothetical protein ES703_123537 [subsurface metagenome]